MTTEREIIQNCVPRIIAWYAASRRVLPWREEPTPYHVWISEIMLQQTRIEAAIPYYQRFLRELPTVEALAAVEEDRLLKLWEGLGYYSRARNLKKAAVQLMESYGGVLPAQASELKKLPGIGDYTAGAIASIAYGQPEPAVDGNVLRVLMRLLACGEDIMEQKTRTRSSQLLRENYPRGEDAALLTEGIMELGETVCIPNGEPRCESCPLRGQCRAFAAGSVSDYPVKSPPKGRRIEQRTVLLLHCGGKYAICRRKEQGLLAGLWEFPNVLGALTEQEVLSLVREQGAQPLSCAPCGEAKHIFSHVEWHMTGWHVDCGCEAAAFLWKTAEEIRDEYSIPTAFRFYQKSL